MGQTALAPIQDYLNAPQTKSLMDMVLREKRQQAVLALVNITRQNPALELCSRETLLGCAIKSAALGLTLDQSMGECWVIPYNRRAQIDGVWKVVETQAQFQIGWRGYLKLATNTGKYSRLNVLPCVEGEYRGLDDFGEPVIGFINTPTRSKMEVVGYYARFALHDGFSKGLYWSKEQILEHAQHYSESFRKAKAKDKSERKGKSESPWEDAFDQMACKTVLTQLIRKGGFMSIDMEMAYGADQSVVTYGEDGTAKTAFVDSPRLLPEPPETIGDAAVKELAALINGNDPSLVKARRMMAKDIVTGLGIPRVVDIPVDRLEEVKLALTILDGPPADDPAQITIDEGGAQ
jgi:recombination protein RecT